MGMPACTITSQTAHGGIVTLGFPTVLIGMMPASRIGDLHVCPMVTVLVPHVGGPFALGSPTVLVGMMPQSRVTDMLVCVGPPDIAAMGCETVLVGMAGAGGAGGAMGGISAMGVAVPMAVNTASSNGLQAQLQGDGTIQTSVTSGALPPIPLAHPTWPDLPPAHTSNFQSVQPVDLPPGTTLYRVIDDPAMAAGSYWSTTFPSTSGLVAMAQVPAGGLKAWMGAAAGLAGIPQVWTPPGGLNPSQIV